MLFCYRYAGRAKEVSDLIGILKIEGIDMQAGLSMNGRIATEYLKMLNFFCMDLEVKIDALKYSIMKKDLNLYIAIVHAIKNSAMNVGATGVAEFAKQLEHACESKSIHFIMENNERFISDLIRLQENIRPALSGGLSERPGVMESDPDYLYASLARVKKALRNMAIGEAKRILTELKTMTWEREIRDTIIEISRCVLLFEYDKATSIIDEIST